VQYRVKLNSKAPSLTKLGRPFLLDLRNRRANHAARESDEARILNVPLAAELPSAHCGLL
jgi:hypothetical protein